MTFMKGEKYKHMSEASSKKVTAGCQGSWNYEALGGQEAGDDGGGPGHWDGLSPAPLPSPPPPRVFFRRHYPLATHRFCGMDPEQRK